jgi:hypothetical protein
MFPWLSRFAYALECLQFQGGPAISVQHLRETPRSLQWASAWHEDSDQHWKPSTPEIFSVLAYFLGGCDIAPSDLQRSTTGISFRDSLYVPTEVSFMAIVFALWIIYISLTMKRRSYYTTRSRREQDIAVSLES